MPASDRAIAIAATFTAEALQPGLAFWAGELSLDHEIRFAAYNQVFQQLLDPAGLFAHNRGGWNVVLVRCEDWLRDGGAGLEDRARQLADAVRAAAASFSVPLILAVCPSTQPFDCLERGLLEAVADLPSVHTIAPADVAARYPVEEIHDPHANELGHLPYTPEYFVALATAVARRIHAISQPPRKVVALDCDETLWAGICGEDGPHGVVVDEPRRALQEFMAARRREGMLLALCSKNNEEDVVETFRAHPAMPLALDDFAATRINWESKGAGLAGLAADLDLGLDSFILIDDNPKECIEAQAGAPGVLALALPEAADEIPAFLDHVWAFDRARITDEDRRRPELYAQRADRSRAERASASLEEFLRGLQLEVRVAPMEPAQLPRVAQLTQRTNQMNASCIRRGEAEILALDAECLTVDVKDRFGGYGLTGVVIFCCPGDTLLVDTFLLSCRVLGRGVEHRVVAHLGEIARRRGLAWVEIPYVPSQRNRPARLFLESIGGERLSASAAASIEYAPHPLPSNSRPSADLPPSRDREGAVPRVDYHAIATGLRTPAAILARIHAAAPPQPRAVALPPRTPLERDLAELWAALLNLEAVGVNDNFFELGGHSLLAVQLLSRVRQIYGVELSLEVVYSGDFTVAELAKALELKEIEQSGGDYQELLRELDALSDDEVRALLAEEDAQ